MKHRAAADRVRSREPADDGCIASSKGSPTDESSPGYAPPTIAPGQMAQNLNIH